MLKIRLSLLCGLLIALLLIPVFAFAEADGFRNIKCGTDFSTLTDMQYVRTDPSHGGIEIYTKKVTNLRLVAQHLKVLNMVSGKVNLATL